MYIFEASTYIERESEEALEKSKKEEIGITYVTDQRTSLAKNTPRLSTARAVQLNP